MLIIMLLCYYVMLLKIFVNYYVITKYDKIIRYAIDM